MPKGAPDSPDFSITGTVNTWIRKGAPRDQLVLGIPYYGQGWTGVTDGLFGAATGPAPGLFAAGSEDYKTLKNLPAQGYDVVRDSKAGHTYLWNGETFWTYDDPTQLAQKTAYIKMEGLGGAMMVAPSLSASHEPVSVASSAGSEPSEITATLVLPATS